MSNNFETLTYLSIKNWDTLFFITFVPRITRSKPAFLTALMLPNHYLMTRGFKILWPIFESMRCNACDTLVAAFPQKRLPTNISRMQRCNCNLLYYYTRLSYPPPNNYPKNSTHPYHGKAETLFKTTSTARRAIA